MPPSSIVRISVVREPLRICSLRPPVQPKRPPIGDPSMRTWVVNLDFLATAIVSKDLVLRHSSLDRFRSVAKECVVRGA